MTAETRDAAETLLYRYGAIADANDLEGVGEFFAMGAVEFPNESASGRDEVTALLAARWPVRQRHVITNVRVEEGNVAHAQYAVWLFEPDPVMAVLGTYELHFDLTDDGPRARRLTVVRVWQRA